MHVCEKTQQLPLFLRLTREETRARIIPEQKTEYRLIKSGRGTGPVKPGNLFVKSK